VFPAEQVAVAASAGRARAHFRVRFGAYFTGAVPDSLGGQGLVRAFRQLPVPAGSAFEIEVDPEAAGYRLTRDESRVTLELARREGEGFEPFAPEGTHGPRSLRVVVIDPGHGGDDAGAVSGDLVEKDLALKLALRVKSEIEKRVHARVVLTRTADVALTGDQRAEAANRARADLVLSLHFDGYPSGAARGATAWCAPATVAESREAPRSFALPVEVAPWRDVALRNAVPSRALAEMLRSSLELAGLGPVRLREKTPAALLGVSAPGVLLECATLTSPTDRGRLATEDGLKALATGIVDGVVAYQRNE
jgi:N-acetylmuramoyl-L-alanine amidase